ncbi:hypothetical protein EJB05_49957 [Eragrostis curvula]|uniref:Uncharacterized protein n=1 Tax=Eragrostis curvula TaxID=38414 RepID=A0A5J9T5L2_9POAL|nr:hypothetical protein EJB05_49957 [Eragrostis curvula]
MEPKFTILDERQLIDELRGYLENKRYFIVIDDVWETKSWETIKLALDENNNGSRLIKTTRHSDVAAQAGEVYKLKPLLRDQSEKLFYTRIFGADGTCPDNQLDEVSDKVLNKCDGVPLAIITIASLLVGKPPEQWIQVCKFVFDDKGNQQVSDTEWILSLSYYDLPAHLQTCLLYLSSYPEDYKIEKNRLIWKWVAEGFVQKEEGTGFLEAGEGYFNDLINRSMIMAVESDGVVDGCRVHDMVLDLLRHISQEANFVIIPHNDGTMTIPPSGRVRRLAHQNRTVEPTHHGRHMCLLDHLSCDYKGLSLTSFKLLRVLALEGCKVQKGFIHLEHLESLLHLRYLGLINTITYSRAPKGNRGSEILHLENTAIEELPSSIGQLTQLICLRACKAKVPNGVIEKLTSLEELGISTRRYPAGQLVKELGNLTELRVLVADIHLTSIWETDLVKSLGSLRKIRHLKLDGPMGQDQALWGTTVLPRSLQCLIVPHIDFPALPSCIKPSYLPNLSHLELSVEDMDEKGLKILGGLPKLSHLWLDTSSRVTLTIHAIDYGCFFQTLRFLSLPNSTVWFVLNKNSSVSFTLWNAWHYKDFGTETREVSTLSDDNGSCDNLGLECIPSLQKVKVNLWCGGAIPDGVEKAEAALRKVIEVLHPNRPTLEMIVYHFSGLILDPSLMLISAAGMFTSALNL